MIYTISSVIQADRVLTKAPACLFPAEPLEEFEGSKSERPLATALWGALRGLSSGGGTAREYRKC